MTVSKIERNENGIRVIDGIEYPSVTTILKDDSYAKVPKHILKAASERGNEIHLLLENILQGQDFEVEQRWEFVANSMITGLNALNKGFVNIQYPETEKTVWHRDLLFSGQLDYKFKCNMKSMIDPKKRVTAIVDFKTSAEKKASHLKQIAAYVMADFNMKTWRLAQNGSYDENNSKSKQQKLTRIASNGKEVKVLLPDPNDYFGILIYAHKKNEGIVATSGTGLHTSMLEFMEDVERYSRIERAS